MVVASDLNSAIVTVIFCIVDVKVVVDKLALVCLEVRNGLLVGLNVGLLSIVLFGELLQWSLLLWLLCKRILNVKAAVMLGWCVVRIIHLEH